jgi:hypothetical protein
MFEEGRELTDAIGTLEQPEWMGDEGSRAL